MIKPLISVIIPSYNHSQYISQNITSIFNQTYGQENIQLIVIDDCSTDDSVIVVTELQKKFDFLFIVNKSNKGICKNINHCLTFVNGEYVCITGSDDYWCLDKLEQQVQYMEENPDVAVCSGNAIKVDSFGNILPEKEQKQAPERTYGFKEVIMRDFPFSTTLALIRKEVLDKVGNYDHKLKIEDYYMWLKISHAGFKLHLLKQQIGYYRIHQHNTINKSILIYDEMRKILAAYQLNDLYCKAIKRLNIVYFPQIALLDKKRAMQLLPSAISNTQFFYRGIYYLLKFNK